MASADNIIVYQGETGANSHAACQAVYPDMEAVGKRTFEDAFIAVEQGDAKLAMIAIENSVAGRVADIHHLLPHSSLYIIGEHFQRIHHQLVGIKGASTDGLKRVYSHIMALGQCRGVIHDLGLEAIAAADTAGAAREVAERGNPEEAAIASSLAAEVYGLDILQADIEDEDHNTTRFVIMAKDPDDADPEDGPCITSLIFRVRNVPAALYKAMAGFATNGVNLTKLESYQIGGSFQATQFYADIEGHPRDRAVRLALEELQFFSDEVRVLGVYKAHAYRKS